MSSDMTIKRDIKEKKQKQMRPTIKNQLGNFIEEEAYRKEIESMIHNNLKYTYIDNRKITLQEKFKTDDVCTVVVHIEGLE